MESSVLTTDFCLIFNRYFYDCLCYCATSLFICLFISDYLALAGALREEEIPWVLKWVWLFFYWKNISLSQSQNIANTQFYIKEIASKTLSCNTWNKWRDRWQWTGAQLRTEPTDPGTREEQALQGTQNPSRALFSCICCDGRCCYSKAELLWCFLQCCSLSRKKMPAAPMHVKWEAASNSSLICL